MLIFHPFTFAWYFLGLQPLSKSELFLYLVDMPFPPMRDFQFGWSWALRL